MFGFGIEPDARKSDVYAVYMAQGGTTLPDRDYYLKDDARYVEVRAAYRKYIAELSALFGHPNPSQVADHVMELEKSFAESQWTQVELRDRSRITTRRG